MRRLEGIEERRLGPGWDATIVESRVRALITLGRSEDARVEWKGLASRWPGEEEALLPSWLGQAELAKENGSPSEAMQLAEQARVTASDPGYIAQAEAMIASLQ